MSKLTQSLSGMVRRLRGMGPQEPVEVELNALPSHPEPESQTETDTDTDTDTEASPSEAAAATEVLEREDEPNEDVDDQDSESERHGLLARFSGRQRDEAIAELQRGYSEVIDLARAVRTHMETQSERSERMVGLMDRLSQSMQALPESGRNQSRMLEALQNHIDVQARQSGDLNETMRGLSRHGEHQAQVLGVIQQQLDANHDTDREMLGSIGRLNETMGRINESNHASVSVLKNMADQGATVDRHMQELITRNQRHMTTLSVATWAIAAAVIGVAAWVAVSVGQLRPADGPMQPTAAIGLTAPDTGPAAPAPAEASSAEPTRAESELQPVVASEEPTPAEPAAETDAGDAAAPPESPSGDNTAETPSDPPSEADLADASTPKAITESH